MSANSPYSPTVRSLPAGKDARNPYALLAGRAGPVRAGPVRAGIVAGMAGLLSGWRQRARQRRALAELPAHLLHDIGIDRRMALLESMKPFWRP
jgi:uncharacterized protein YjiS (DUF1127 family)